MKRACHDKDVTVDTAVGGDDEKVVKGKCFNKL